MGRNVKKIAISVSEEEIQEDLEKYAKRVAQIIDLLDLRFDQQDTLVLSFQASTHVWREWTAIPQTQLCEIP